MNEGINPQKGKIVVIDTIELTDFALLKGLNLGRYALQGLIDEFGKNKNDRFVIKPYPMNYNGGAMRGEIPKAEYDARFERDYKKVVKYFEGFGFEKIFEKTASRAYGRKDEGDDKIVWMGRNQHFKDTVPRYQVNLRR